MQRGKIIAAACGMLGLAGWCAVENGQLIRVNYNVKVRGLPKSFNGKKILHLSDLHMRRFGEGFNNLLNSCSFCKPDYIFFTGDLFSRNEENLAPKVVLMRRLMKIAPVYYVMGNHEVDVPEKSAALNCRLRREGVKILINERERIYSGEDFIDVYGLALGVRYYKSENGGYGKISPVDAETVGGLLGRPETGVCSILLAHNPLAFERYAQWGADLVFSGHVHGGIIRLPYLGGLLSPERRFFPKYTRGIYELDNSQMIVSAGLGKFRLNNPAEIICVTLHAD